MAGVATATVTVTGVPVSTAQLAGAQAQEFLAPAAGEQAADVLAGKDDLALGVEDENVVEHRVEQLGAHGRLRHRLGLAAHQFDGYPFGRGKLRCQSLCRHGRH